MRTLKPLLALAPVLALAAAAAPAAAQSLVRHPYLQLQTPTAVTLVWTTDTATDSRVRYGLGPQDLAFTVDKPGDVTQHEVRITNLAPGTRYYYSVGTTAASLEGGDTTHYFETSPPLGTPKKFRAWVVGDSGYNIPATQQVRDAMLAYVGNYRPHLFLHMGDMAYNSGTTEEFTSNFFGLFTSTLRNTVVWPAFGNHEGLSALSSTQSGPYYTAYVLPTAGEAGGLPSGTEAYYSFDYANVHFVVLNSYDISRSPSGAMLTWLAADLAATDQEWLIAYWHNPPYTKGSHDSDVETDHIEMRENALPLLEAAGVDLVLGGHSHIYERSYLVDSAYDTPTTAAGHILDSGDGKPLGDGPYAKLAGGAAHDGAVYVVAGHGAFAGGAGNHPLMYFSETQAGSCLLDVQGNRLSMVNVRADGVVTDRFSILKGAGLVVGAPDGGERIEHGTSTSVRWATEGNIPAVNLEYSADDGATWNIIAQGIPNLGQYTWAVPLIETTRALVRVSDAQNPSVSDESNMGFTVRRPTQVAIQLGDYWTYDDSGINHGSSWLSAGFDDSDWSAGPAQLGYGDGDEVTPIAATYPSRPSVYFRKIIPIDAPVAQAVLDLVHDDGVVVWVNGVQVFSRYVGNTSYGAFATQGSVDNEHSSAGIPLSPNPFVVGSNVIAAMVKQSDATSSDLSFDLQLTLSFGTAGSSGSSSSSSSSSGAGGSGGGGGAGGASSTSSSSTSASSSSASSTSASSSSASSTSASSSSASSGASSGAGGAGGAGGDACLGYTPTCVSFRRGTYGTVRDATIWQVTPTYVDGASASLYTGTSASGYRVSLLWFDLTPIPAQATVCSSTLRLNQSWKSAASTVRVHEVFSPWLESTVSWSSLNQSWDNVPIGAFTASGGGGDRTLNVTDLVQDWVDGTPNDGFMIEETPAIYTQFYSSEYATVERRPRLDVCYIP